MRLRQPSAVYNPLHEIQRNQDIEQADAENHKRNRDVEIGPARLILTDDNGIRYEVYVDTNGNLQADPIGDAIVVDLTRDAFGRARISNPQTLFDSKQLFDDAPLFFDDSETSGSGTSSSHSTDKAATTMGVAATTAGTRVRQTFQRFNYQPGKGQLVLVTGNLEATGGGTGIQTKMGYFDDQNGFFLMNDEGTPTFVKRSYITGSAVDTEVAQSSWNGDKLDGTGASGKTIDLSKSQIMWTAFEWLGVGSAFVGVVIDGAFILCHTFNHANEIASTYMSTPNLPIRYEISNDGTGVASTMEHICSTVISEGGIQENGSLRYKSTEGTHVNADTANAIYAIVGLRLKSTHTDAVVNLQNVTSIVQTSDDYEWMLIFNPTVAGTFTYSDETNSSCQTATGATANTVTGGTIIDGGFVKAGNQGASVSSSVSNALRLGSSIAGTVDEVVLCVRPLATNADVEGSITWRELA